MNEEIEALRGQMHGLSQLLTHVILQMTPIDAARAAAGLSLEHFGTQGYDESEPGNPHEMQARHELVQTYLDLLKAVAQRA
jgi:hypothetical protein